MERLVCFYPDEIRALLVTLSLYDVKASFFHDHFVVQYSEQGSNGRTAEAVMLNWVEDINDCASGTDVASMRVCVCVCVCACVHACVCSYMHVYCFSVMTLCSLPTPIIQGRVLSS